MAKFQKKAIEVEAVQLTEATLGQILAKIQSYFKTAIDFSVIMPTEITSISVKYELKGEQYIIYTDQYVVFDKNDFDIMGDVEFKKMFEPVPAKVNYNPNPFSPSPLKPWQPRQYPIEDWNDIIVKD